MNDEVKMPIELRGMSPEECILLIQDTFKMHNATISRLTEEVDKERRDRCDTCGAKVSSYPNGCPTCGAPQCCQWCCKRDALQKELDEARGKVERVLCLISVGVKTDCDIIDLCNLLDEIEQILKGGGE